MGDHSHR